MCVEEGGGQGMKTTTCNTSIYLHMSVCVCVCGREGLSSQQALLLVSYLTQLAFLLASHLAGCQEISKCSTKDCIVFPQWS